jgi:hypothetical protein
MEDISDSSSIHSTIDSINSTSTPISSFKQRKRRKQPCLTPQGDQMRIKKALETKIKKADEIYKSFIVTIKDGKFDETIKKYSNFNV